MNFGHCIQTDEALSSYLWKTAQFNEEFSGQNYHARVHQQVAMCPGLIIRKVAWNPILLLFFPKINITKLVGCALDLKKKKIEQ